uniref:PLA2c domain-containing protein n=2 Tax=Latimeria chalumnae TaxID=7897 RepID=H2ZRZ5_LATCH
KVPTVAILGSGGGLRAMVALLGTLKELEKQNLLETATYISGVSGSTWCMSPLYEHKDWSKNIKEVAKTILEEVTEGTFNMDTAFRRVVDAAKSETYSFTDLWAATLVYKMTHQMDSSHLSDQVDSVNSGENPYPIYAVINKSML